MEIEGKIALVTGGASGLGFAYATELLRNGALHVAILDIPNSKGEQAADKLNGEFGKGRAFFAVCDVTKPQQLEDGFAKTVKEFGGLDIVINNAGILDDSKWELMIDVNLNGLMRGTLLGLQHMGKNRGGKGGTIVNIASIAGLIPFSPCPVYTATKHAVVGLSRSFATPDYFDKFGVRILVLCPGVTDTPMVTESASKFSSMADQEILDAAWKIFPTQKIESVSQAMMYIIKSAKNGTVWVIDGGEPVYEIPLLGYEEMKACAKKS